MAADALAEVLDQGPPVPGLGPVPDLALVPPEPVFQPAPPAPPLQFKPAPAAPPLPLPQLDAVSGGKPTIPPGAVPDAPPAAPAAPAAQPPSLDQQALDVAGQQGKQDVATAQVTADQAKRQADQAEATAQAKQRAVTRGVQYVDAAMSNWRKKVDAFDNAKIEDYWADKTTGDKVVAGIALAFGALGAGLTGFAGKSTGNLAAEQLTRNIDQHYNRERQRIERLKDSVAIARTGILDAVSAKKELLDDVDATEAAALKAVEARGIANMKAQGIPAAEIAANKTIMEMRTRQAALEATKQRQHEQDAIAAERDRVERLRIEAQTAKLKRETAMLGKGKGGKGGKMVQVYDANLQPVMGPDGKPLMRPEKVAQAFLGSSLGVAAAGAKAEGKPDKPPTEAQAKNALLAQQIDSELDTIEKNAPLSGKALSTLQRNESAAESSAKASAEGGISGFVSRTARAKGLATQSKYEDLNPGEQKVANAWDNAIEKAARVLTGAGMPQEEARRLTVQMAPHAGDSPELVKQKLQRMRAFAAEQRSTTGSAGEMTRGAAASVAPQSESTTGGRPGTVAGRPAIIYPDRTFEFIGGK